MAIDGEIEPIAAPHETAVEEYQGIVRLILQPPKAHLHRALRSILG